MSNNKKHSLLLNMTEEEKALFLKSANDNYMTLSAYIRWCVHQMIKKKNN